VDVLVTGRGLAEIHQRPGPFATSACPLRAWIGAQPAECGPDGRPAAALGDGAAALGGGEADTG
jgi:hypothetical protein